MKIPIFLFIGAVSSVYVSHCRNASDCGILFQNGSHVQACEGDYVKTNLCTDDGYSVCTVSGDGSLHKGYTYLSSEREVCEEQQWFNMNLGDSWTCSDVGSWLADSGMRFYDLYQMAAFNALAVNAQNYCLENDAAMPEDAFVSWQNVTLNFSYYNASAYAIGWRVDDSEYTLRMCNNTSGNRVANESCTLQARFTTEAPAEITFNSESKEVTISNEGPSVLDCTLRKKGFSLGAKVKERSTKVVPLPAEAYQLSDYLLVRCVSEEGYVTEASFYVPSEEMCIIHGCIQCWELFESLACLPTIWQITLVVLLVIVVLALFSITPCLLPMTMAVISLIWALLKKIVNVARRHSKKMGVLIATSNVNSAYACDVGGSLSGAYTACQEGVCAASYSTSFSLSTGQQACISDKFMTSRVSLSSVQAVYSMTFAYFTSDYHVETWTGVVCQSPFELVGCGEQSCEHFDGNAEALTEYDLDRSSTRHAVHQYCFHKNIDTCVQIGEACAVGRTYIKPSGPVYRVFKITSAVYTPVFRIDEFFNATNHTSYVSGLVPLTTNSSVYVIDELSNVAEDDIVGLYYFYSTDHSFIAPASAAGSPVAHQFGDIQASGSGYFSDLPIKQTANVVYQYESSASFNNDDNKVLFNTHSSPFSTRPIQTRVPGGTRVANLEGNSTRLWGTVIPQLTASMTIESKSQLYLKQVIANICPFAEFQKTEGCYNCDSGARACFTVKSNCEVGLAQATIDGETYPVVLNNTPGVACFPFQSSKRSGSDVASFQAGNNKASVKFSYDLHYINPNYKTYNTKDKSAAGVGNSVAGTAFPEWAWIAILVAGLVVAGIVLVCLLNTSRKAAVVILKKRV